MQSKSTIISKSEEKPLYTREETAELLDVSLTTLHHWNKTIFYLQKDQT